MAIHAIPEIKKTILVIGNGMVGMRFIEKIKKYDTSNKYTIICIGEEASVHYNRMLLTEYFEHRDAKLLNLGQPGWHENVNISVLVNARVRKVLSASKQVEYEFVLKQGEKLYMDYDFLVFATGSYAYLPPLEGIGYSGVFVYRTLLDLDNMILYAKDLGHVQESRGKDTVGVAAIVGGGLLGLEAAKALRDLGLSVVVLERNPRLLPRQIDGDGHVVLMKKVLDLGIQVRLNHRTKRLCGGKKQRVSGLEFEDGSFMKADMVVFATGIRPRDEVAKISNVNVREHDLGGGIVVNDQLETSMEDIYAIGECAVHRNKTYGLVAPGYAMAEVVASNLVATSNGEKQLSRFEGSDMSTKLKLLGVEVASFGVYQGNQVAELTPLVYNNPAEGIYKKLYFSNDLKYLRGGILVGDASEYSKFLLFVQTKKKLKDSPSVLLFGNPSQSNDYSIDDLPDEAQVCSCNNVSKGDLKVAIRENKKSCLKDLKLCTNAGTGCGGCLPMVKDIMTAELKAMGSKVDNSLCEHFAYTRQELFDMIKINDYRTFTTVLQKHGHGNGCEICKPTIASILASLYNAHILEGELFSLQDSNDRYLANLQKNGQYSVIPRVPGGEITPQKLKMIAEVAAKYNLYTKITGGQRVDLLGASAWQLPVIWEDLVNAGFESGHAYGKALRTVKSCVGSAWCRYGRGDAVSFAIELEERYRGIRSPHKIKGGVSGCIRECAEAQSKDFGLIATETGYNIYLGGNGGTTPKHAILFATDVSKANVIKYLDRYLMYYIHTADRLERTSKWLGRLEGGIKQLQRIVIEDALHIADTLDAHMQLLINTYECEWKKVVHDPIRRKQFDQFRNTTNVQASIVNETTRGQIRPITSDKSASWTNDKINIIHKNTTWVSIGAVSNFSENAGEAILYGESQLAIFNTTKLENGLQTIVWYATQNMCPKNRAFVLSRSIVGDQGSIPKIACPIHKGTFNLLTGESFTDPALAILTFSVKQVNDTLFAKLPPAATLDKFLSTQNSLPTLPMTQLPIQPSICGNNKLEW